MQHVAQADPKLAELLAHRESEIIEQAEIQVKYESYFDKEIEIVNKMKRMEDQEINPEFDYSTLISLSKEAREKLIRSEEHTSELHSLMHISYAVFGLKKKIQHN